MRGRRASVFLALVALCAPSTIARAQENPSKIANTPAEKYAIAPGGVDMRTGRYVYDETDLTIGGKDDALALRRMTVANSLGSVKAFGNFASNWDISLTELRIDASKTGEVPPIGGSDYRVYVNVGGRIETFQAWNGSGFQQMSQGAEAILTWTGVHDSANAIYTMKGDDGTAAIFRPFATASGIGVNRTALISSLTEPDGTVLAFDYDTSSGTRLRRVTSNRGYALLMEGSAGQTTKACVLNLSQTTVPANNLCPADVPTTTYTYTSFSGTRLASVTDANSKISSFIYSGNPQSGSFQMAFTKAGQSTPWLTNTIGFTTDEQNFQQEYVSLQSYADGESYTYAYELTPNEAPPVTIIGGSYTNALGEATDVLYSFPVLPTAGPGYQCTHFPCEYVLLDNIVYQQTSGPATITDPTGKTTLLNYCNPNSVKCYVDLLNYSTDPEGNKTYFTYAGRNVVQVRKVAKPGSGLADIITSATYGCFAGICSKMTSSTDANQNTTNYNYDPVHAGILSEIKPAPSTGAPRPLKLTSWTQKYAYIKDAGGALVPAASPVWVVATETDCQTVAGGNSPVCDGAATQRVTTYQYGADGTANNLWVRGVAVTADGTTRRTCFGYDQLGRKVSETTPKAYLASCP